MNLEKVIAVRTNKCVYRDGEYAVKVFDSDYSKADVLNEALNQARVEETGLAIPKVKEVTTIDGKWAIVSDYIPGKTLDRLMKENPEKKDEYLEAADSFHIEELAVCDPESGELLDRFSFESIDFLLP